MTKRKQLLMSILESQRDQEGFTSYDDEVVAVIEELAKNALERESPEPVAESLTAEGSVI